MGSPFVPFVCLWLLMQEGYQARGRKGEEAQKWYSQVLVVQAISDEVFGACCGRSWEG